MKDVFSTLLTFSQAGFFISDSNLEYSKLSYTIVNIFHSTSSKIPTINIAPEIPRPIVIGSGGPGGHPEGKIKFITNSVNITLKVWPQTQIIATFGIIIIGFFSWFFFFWFGFFCFLGVFLCGFFFVLSSCDKIRLPYLHCRDVIGDDWMTKITSHMYVRCFFEIIER